MWLIYEKTVALNWMCCVSSGRVDKGAIEKSTHQMEFVDFHFLEIQQLKLLTTAMIALKLMKLEPVRYTNEITNLAVRGGVFPHRFPPFGRPLIKGTCET